MKALVAVAVLAAATYFAVSWHSERQERLAKYEAIYGTRDVLDALRPDSAFSNESREADVYRRFWGVRARRGASEPDSLGNLRRFMPFIVVSIGHPDEKAEWWLTEGEARMSATIAQYQGSAGTSPSSFGDASAERMADALTRATGERINPFTAGAVLDAITDETEQADTSDVTRREYGGIGRVSRSIRHTTHRKARGFDLERSWSWNQTTTQWTVDGRIEGLSIGTSSEDGHNAPRKDCQSTFAALRSGWAPPHARLDTTLEGMGRATSQAWFFRDGAALFVRAFISRLDGDDCEMMFASRRLMAEMIRENLRPFTGNLVLQGSTVAPPVRHMIHDFVDLPPPPGFIGSNEDVVTSEEALVLPLVLGSDWRNAGPYPGYVSPDVTFAAEADLTGPNSRDRLYVIRNADPECFGSACTFAGSTVALLRSDNHLIVKFRAYDATVDKLIDLNGDGVIEVVMSSYSQGGGGEGSGVTVYSFANDRALVLYKGPTMEGDCTGAGERGRTTYRISVFEEEDQTPSQFQVDTFQEECPITLENGAEQPNRKRHSGSHKLSSRAQPVEAF